MRIWRIAAALSAAGLLLCGCQSLGDFSQDHGFTPKPPSAQISDTKTLDLVDADTTKFVGDELAKRCSNINDLKSFQSCRIQNINDLCVAYFTQLDRASTQAQWGQREFNTLADFTSTLMGLTGTPAQQLAILAGTKLAVNDTFNATDDALLLSPAPHKIYVLVEKQRDEIAKPASDNDFDSVMNYVRTYAYQCTPPGIRQIVDQAIQAQTASGSSDPNANPLLAQLLKDLGAKLGAVTVAAATPALGQINVDDAKYLYRLLVLTQPGDSASPPLDPTIGNYLKSRPGLFERVQAAQKSPATLSEIQGILSDISAAAPPIRLSAQEMVAVATPPSLSLPPTPTIAESDLVPPNVFTTTGNTIVQIKTAKDSSGNVTYVTMSGGTWGATVSTAASADFVKTLTARVP